jgi:ubiquinone/menaquinone biosynthesis C-methylase UbiE
VLSARPARITAEVENARPYPRHRGDPHLAELRREIMGHLGLAESWWGPKGASLSDLLTHIEEQPLEVLDVIARSMSIRAAESAMQSICARYMGKIGVPDAHVLEVGCGNGAATKLIMQHLRPARLVGIDPSSLFINLAKETFNYEPRASFERGDAASTGQPDANFDIVIAHTVYSHLLDPEGALAEAWRVLKPGGQLVVFDGDFATLGVALFDGDPLQSAVGMVLRNMVHAPLHHAAASYSRRCGWIPNAIAGPLRVRADDAPRVPAHFTLARNQRGRSGWRDWASTSRWLRPGGAAARCNR